LAVALIVNVIVLPLTDHELQYDTFRWFNVSFEIVEYQLKLPSSSVMEVCVMRIGMGARVAVVGAAAFSSARQQK
jgi:hypothetical protein